MATNNIEGLHSWESMSDEELLRSAGLYGRTEQQEKVDIIWQQLCYWEKMI